MVARFSSAAFVQCAYIACDPELCQIDAVPPGALQGAYTHLITGAFEEDSLLLIRGGVQRNSLLIMGLSANVLRYCYKP